MPVVEFRQAIRDALDAEFARDERVIFLGEDVAAAGGVFAVTPGLVEKHGSRRVVDTPISELPLAGAAFASATGSQFDRPGRSRTSRACSVIGERIEEGGRKRCQTS